MLEKKTVLVTGASRGIGKAIALLFAEHGAFVGINYHKNEDAAKGVLKKIHGLKGDGVLLKGDVSSTRDVNRMVQQLVEQRKHIDVLVLNAGIYKRSSFAALPGEQWDETLAVNLTGCFNVCKAALPYMKEKGSIIFISSQLAFRGSSHGADYAASKAGLLGLMRSLALELAPKRIRVNAIAPGTIDTDLLSNYTEEMKRKRAAEIPLGRLGTPEDVAKVCLFLASDLSSYITGETIHVNGGLYIH